MSTCLGLLCCAGRPSLLKVQVAVCVTCGVLLVPGDGVLDVLTGAPGASMAMWYQNAGGVQWRPFNMTTVTSAVGVIAVDTTGDGFMDVFSASTTNNQVAWFRSGGLCEPGTYGVLGAPPCTPCQAGTFSATRGQSACTRCPVGRYGVGAAGVGLLNATLACPWTCDAGYACPPGTASALQVITCASGLYSQAMSAVCVACPAGRYGATPALVNASCTGGCDAGYACPAGSTGPVLCDPGRFSAPGVAVCTTLLPAASVPVLSETPISSGDVGYSWIAIHDVNLDQRLDVVATNAAARRIEWCRNEGGTPPTWTNFTVASYPISGSNAQTVSVGLIDDDAYPDIVTAFGGNVQWFKNEGGSPPVWTPYTISTYSTFDSTPAAFALADLNQDSAMDIVSGSYSGLVVYISDGVFPFGWTTTTIPNIRYSLSVQAVE
jgi:hypothetical protein